MATREIGLSILWEWLHKATKFSEADEATGVAEGDKFSAELFACLLAEGYAKLRATSNRDVHDDSGNTAVPVAREIVETYVAALSRPPRYIDLLNINLNNGDLAVARQQIGQYMDAFGRDGTRITQNLDFEVARSTAV